MFILIFFGAGVGLFLVSSVIAGFSAEAAAATSGGFLLCLVTALATRRGSVKLLALVAAQVWAFVGPLVAS